MMQQRSSSPPLEASAAASAAVEIDTRGMPPTLEPIHFKAKRITLPPTPTDPDGNDERPRLTLSAFRRPPVRLTKSNPSRVLEQEYNLRSPGCGILGHGAFSTVRLAYRNQDGLKVAVKSIAKHDALRARRLRSRPGGRVGGHRQHLDEWTILQEMKDHPYIITLLDVFETDEQIHLVTEFCQGGELFDAIQKKRMRSPSVQRGHYSEPQAACITRQLLTALKDLHARNIVHRDLKPENICLVSENDSNIHAKLCDFGMARLFHRRQAGSSPVSTTSDVETPPSTPGKQRSFCAVSCDYYAAPEVCAAGAAHQPSADVYSLGVTLYILLCGFPPVFSDEEQLADQDYVLFPQVQWSSISDGAKQFIRKMLQPDSAKRITAEDALQEDWILRHDVNDAVTTATAAGCAGNGVSAAAAVRLSPDSSPSRNKERVNLEQVRDRLYQAFARLNKDEPALPPAAAATTSSRKKSRRASDAIVSPKRRRRRSLECHRRSSIVCAMKELYSDVATVSGAASAAAAGVVCDKEVRVIEELGYEDPDATTTTQQQSQKRSDSSPPSPFKSPRPAVSV